MKQRNIQLALSLKHLYLLVWPKNVPIKRLCSQIKSQLSKRTIGAVDRVFACNNEGLEFKSRFVCFSFDKEFAKQ